MDSIQQTIKQYILDEFLPGTKPAELTDTTPLISGGILDSLSALKLVQFLEETYHIEFQPYEVSVDYLDTTAQIAALVESKL